MLVGEASLFMVISEVLELSIAPLFIDDDEAEFTETAADDVVGEGGDGGGAGTCACCSSGSLPKCCGASGVCISISTFLVSSIGTVMGASGAGVRSSLLRFSTSVRAFAVAVASVGASGGLVITAAADGGGGALPFSFLVICICKSEKKISVKYFLHTIYYIHNSPSYRRQRLSQEDYQQLRWQHW